MNLFDINQAIYKVYSLFENGEITEDEVIERLEALQITKDKKIENTALFIKNQRALINALKTEKKALDERIKTKERTLRTSENNLTFELSQLPEERFETEKVQLKFTKSSPLHIEDETKFLQELEAKKLNSFISVKTEKKINKDDVKKYIKDREEANKSKEDEQAVQVFENAYIQVKQNLQVK